MLLLVLEAQSVIRLEVPSWQTVIHVLRDSTAQMREQAALLAPVMSDTTALTLPKYTTLAQVDIRAHQDSSV